MTWGGRKVATLRALVVQTYGVRCWLCGRACRLDVPPRHPDYLTVDHRVARHDGGSDAIENLAPAHLRCNTRRGKRPPSSARPSRRSETGGSFFCGTTTETPLAASISPRTPPKNRRSDQVSPGKGRR